MSQLQHRRPGRSITSLADREVNDEDRAVLDLLRDLRGDEDVVAADTRVDGEASFRNAGTAELQDYGYSVRYPFSYEAVSTAEFESDETVTVYARDGAILLVSTRDAVAPTDREVVDVALGVANVPTRIAVMLDDHDARMVPESVEVSADGTLAFSVAAPSAFERVEDRDLREFGSGQTILTVPKDALDLAGLGAGDDVTVRVMRGAVLLDA